MIPSIPKGGTQGEIFWRFLFWSRMQLPLLVAAMVTSAPQRDGSLTPGPWWNPILLRMWFLDKINDATRILDSILPGFHQFCHIMIQIETWHDRSWHFGSDHWTVLGPASFSFLNLSRLNPFVWSSSSWEISSSDQELGQKRQLSRCWLMLAAYLESWQLVGVGHWSLCCGPCLPRNVIDVKFITNANLVKNEEMMWWTQNVKNMAILSKRDGVSSSDHQG